MTYLEGLALPRPAEAAVLGVLEFARIRLGFSPDLKQTEVLVSEAKQGILNCSRQWGKSTVSAAKAVYRAYSRPGSLVLVASPGQRQSDLFLDKAEAMAGGMVRRSGAKLLFANGSRIVGLPGTEATVRGYSKVSLLLIDEASRVDDALYRALRPVLAVSNGDIWLMSTPRGKVGFFYDAWEHGGDRWTRFRVAATDCPRITMDYLDHERQEFGEAWFRQEFMCDFVDSEGVVFGRDLVEAAVDDELEPL